MCRLDGLPLPLRECATASNFIRPSCCVNRLGWACTQHSVRYPRHVHHEHDTSMSHACMQACRVELHPRSASQMCRQEFDPWSLADAPCSPVKLDDPGFRVSEDRITCLGIARARSRILVEPPIEQNSWSWYRTTSQPAPLDLAADTRDMGSHVSWIFLVARHRQSKFLDQGVKSVMGRLAARGRSAIRTSRWFIGTRDLLSTLTRHTVAEQDVTRRIHAGVASFRCATVAHTPPSVR